MRTRAVQLRGRMAAAVLVCVALAAWPRGSEAQAVTGTILGTVVDSTGAIVEGAKVTITNSGTGLTRTVTPTSSVSTPPPRCPRATMS